MTEGLKFCSWYLQNTLPLPFSDILLICLIPAFPVVWNCPTRANFAVYFYPMNLLWLLGCSQGNSPAGFRAIWMKSSPPKAGTRASTSCHPFRTTHVAANPLKTAELLQTRHSQPSGSLGTKINICLFFILENAILFKRRVSQQCSVTHPGLCLLQYTLELFWTRILKKMLVFGEKDIYLGNLGIPLEFTVFPNFYWIDICLQVPFKVEKTLSMICNSVLEDEWRILWSMVRIQSSL